MIDPKHDESVVLLYHKAISSLVRLITGLATAGAFVYLLGWIRSLGYYGSFKAEWILPNLLFAEFALRGVMPSLAILLGLGISFIQIAKNPIGIKLIKEKLFHSVAWLLSVVAMIFLPIYGEHSMTVTAAGFAVFYSASFAMIQFGEVVLELGKSDFRWRSNQILTLLVALIFFVGMTYTLGSTEGERDKRCATSTLPLIVLDDKSPDIWRLLTAPGELYYLVKLSSDMPSIKIIKPEQMKAIVPK